MEQLHKIEIEKNNLNHKILILLCLHFLVAEVAYQTYETTFLKCYIYMSVYVCERVCVYARVRACVFICLCVRNLQILRSSSKEQPKLIQYCFFIQYIVNFLYSFNY